MELKYLLTACLLVVYNRSNRTFMELKLVSEHHDIAAGVRSNRTFMELK